MDDFKIFCFVLVYLIKITNLKNCSSCPIKQAYITNGYVSLTDFNLFNQLNFTDCSMFNLSLLEIKSNQKVILDNSFDLTGLSINPIEKHFGIILKKIKVIICM
jgi:hypothetical protein